MGPVAVVAVRPLLCERCGKKLGMVEPRGVSVNKTALVRGTIICKECGKENRTALPK